MKAYFSFTALLLCSVTTARSVQIGNELIARQYSTDHNPGVLVIDFATSTGGNLESVSTYSQATDSLGFSSQGFSFQLYVLRPGALGLEVKYESPALTVDAVGINTFLLGGFNVQPGDFIAHYGRGIPTTVGGGTAETSTGIAQPVLGQIFSATGNFSHDRTYSIAVNINDLAAVPESGGSLLLLSIGLASISATFGKRRMPSNQASDAESTRASSREPQHRGP